MKPVEVAILGAGGRGFSAYGDFARLHPHLLKCVAVAEPDEAKRARFAAAHALPAQRCFRTWQDLLAARLPVEAVFNCLPEAMHFDSAVLVLEAGYNQLLEKPMATTPHDCARIVAAARRTGRALVVCHVLRYAPFFQTIKEILDSGAIGEVVTVQHTENVSFWHQAHGFVRGPWGRTAEANPMILAKSCHDLDLLVYLIGRKPLRLSSFGSLYYFRPERAPKGAADRCLDGCPAEPTCPYSAYRTYFSHDLPGWITQSDHLGVITSPEQKLEVLRTGPFGRCVFKAGNDVVDHQIVNIEFEGGVTATFMMHAFSKDSTRTLRYGCTGGEIRGHRAKFELSVARFADNTEEVIHPGHLPGGHGGADWAMMHQFVSAIRSGDRRGVLTGADVSLESHLLAFAAEESRLNGGRVIDMDAYRARIEAEVAAS